MSRAVDKMRAEGLPEVAVETFAHYEQRLREGEQGTLPESEIEPLDELPDADELPAGDGAALDQAVVLKLNGGLGTSMGMTRAKSLIEVKDGLSFLDVIVRQVLHLRERHGARIPLLLMNSFATRDDTLAALERYPELPVDDLPLDFVQSKVPKLREDDLEPVEWPADPALEWAPPGHGDVYTSLATSGMLERLLERGYRYLFLSNSDNLGAALDPRILDWFAAEELPFLSESTDRTEDDRKGGHLARRRSDGGLVLRETAQTPDADLDAFEDLERHRFFNCNNIWVDLRALERRLAEQRRGAGPADDRQPQDGRPDRPVVARRAAARDRDGRRDRRVRGRGGAARAARALRAGQDDQPAAGGALGRLRAGGRLDGAAGGRPDPGGVARRRLLQAARRLRVALPRRRRPRCVQCRRLRIDGDVSFGRDVTVKGEVRARGAARRCRTARCSRASAPPPGAPPAARAAAARSRSGRACG